MPNRKLPDDATIKKWHEQGLSFPEMSERHFAATNIHVEAATFNVHCGRLGLPNRNLRHSELIPWTPIRPEHNNDYIVNMLRREGARRSGSPKWNDPNHPDYDAAEVQRLNSWLQGLKDGNHGKGVVVHYDPATTEGWHYVNRQKGDTDIIRAPKGRKTVAPPWSRKRGDQQSA